MIAADRRLDVALLSTDGPAPRYAVAAERTRPRIGEPVVALGLGVHVSGPLIPVIIEGSFAGVGRTPAGDPVFVIHAKIPDGASGGSVVDADGSLIGMVIGYYADRPDLGVVRSLPDIADFLWRHGARLGRGAAGEAGSAPLNDRLVAMSALVQCAPARAVRGAPGVGRDRPAPWAAAYSRRKVTTSTSRWPGFAGSSGVTGVTP